MKTNLLLTVVSMFVVFALAACGDPGDVGETEDLDSAAYDQESEESGEPSVGAPKEEEAEVGADEDVNSTGVPGKPIPSLLTDESPNFGVPKEEDDAETGAEEDVNSPGVPGKPYPSLATGSDSSMGGNPNSTINWAMIKKILKQRAEQQNSNSSLNPEDDGEVWDPDGKSAADKGGDHPSMNDVMMALKYNMRHGAAMDANSADEDEENWDPDQE